MNKRSLADLDTTLVPLGERVIELHTGERGVRTALAGEFRTVGDGGHAGDDHVLDFIGSDESVDRYGDIVRQGGLRLDNFRRNPVIPDCHSYHSIACILGTAEKVDVKDGRLNNRVRFAMDNPLGALAFKMAKSGHIRAQSIGFLPLKWQQLPGSSQGYDFTESELLEISLVVVPANANAVTAALKSGAVTEGDVRSVMELYRSLEVATGAASLSQTKTSPASPEPAPGDGAPEPDWLQSLRTLHQVMRKS